VRGHGDVVRGDAGRWGRALIGTVVAVVTLVCIPAGSTALADGPGSGVRVSGTALLRDGVPFVPQGLTLVGALSPDLSNAVGAAAAQHFGPAELAAATAWGANTVRLQVSQRGLDPLDALHSAAYDQRVQTDVALARADGFVVVLSMQTQGFSGGTGHAPPSAATVRAWQQLAPMFGTDQSVLFELFNEPPGVDDAAHWAQWRDGGSGAVGHQQLVDAVRATGATNVLIADGLRYGKSLYGAPDLVDPLGQLAYGVHPYLNKPINVATAWDTYFGTFAQTHVVIATEWGASSKSKSCLRSWPTLSPQLVSYLRAHRIGLAGLWAFDIPGSAVSTDWTWTPNTFTGWKCGTVGKGPGSLVQSAYLAGW
jgi:Cellulase (glycosyl hydrolase family 5)